MTVVGMSASAPPGSPSSASSWNTNATRPCPNRSAAAACALRRAASPAKCACTAWASAEPNLISFASSSACEMRVRWLIGGGSVGVGDLRCVAGAQSAGEEVAGV